MDDHRIHYALLLREDDVRRSLCAARFRIARQPRVFRLGRWELRER
jgi:hypothetical protein